MEHNHLFLRTSASFVTSSESSGVFGSVRKSLDIVAFSSKILALPGEKSHALI